jgi:hypothetical protein
MGLETKNQGRHGRKSTYSGPTEITNHILKIPLHDPWSRGRITDITAHAFIFGE